MIVEIGRNRFRFALTVAIALLVASAAVPERLSHDWDNIDEYPLGPYPENEFENLIDNPTKITFGGEVDPRDGVVVSSRADVHAVYPVSIRAMRDVLIEFESHAQFVPRVSATDLEKLSDDPLSWLQRTQLSFRFLFFGAEYDLETHHVVRFGGEEPEPEQFGLTSRLVRSPDGKLASQAGSWYLKRIEIDEREYTYVRYYQRIEFAESIFGLRFALRRFGLRGIRETIEAFYDEAVRRAE
ncbi:MAG: hypothetical protein EA426_14020 [Spirochaetaceae bacterium]|nr:MAG: hypothetical protein EA426_14020 [Spirochaetaceae bacterium]